MRKSRGQKGYGRWDRKDWLVEREGKLRIDHQAACHSLEERSSLSQNHTNTVKSHLEGDLVGRGTRKVRAAEKGRREGRENAEIVCQAYRQKRKKSKKDCRMRREYCKEGWDGGDDRPVLERWTF
jgi:hypothetical protein